MLPTCLRVSVGVASRSMWYFAILRYSVIRDQCSASAALLLFQFDREERGKKALALGRVFAAGGLDVSARPRWQVVE